MGFSSIRNVRFQGNPGILLAFFRFCFKIANLKLTSFQQRSLFLFRQNCPPIWCGKLYFCNFCTTEKNIWTKFWGKFSSNGDPRFRHGKISKFHIWTQTYLNVQIARINIFIIIFCFSGRPEGGVRQQLCRYQRQNWRGHSQQVQSIVDDCTSQQVQSIVDDCICQQVQSIVDDCTVNRYRVL
jgi:hypothetical protein